jgi:asparagine synthase (glutamine-hydrolysing)
LRRLVSTVDPARAERIAEKARRLANALAAKTGDDAAISLAAVGLADEELVKGANGTLRLRVLPRLDQTVPNLISRMQANDVATYLPDDILTKVDRCSMAVSLEAREPLLDHRLFEFVWSLPDEIRHGGRSKQLLRDVLARYVPAELTDQPKRGFSIPLDAWLRGPLREWASDLLSSDSLADTGLFEPAGVQAVWKNHLANRRSNATGLWNALMVQAWARRWL